MIIVLSPAKSLDFETPLDRHVRPDRFTQPVLLEQASTLVTTMRQKSPEDLSELMNISPALAELNVQRFANWHTPFDTDNARPALFAFTGDVYTGLQARSLSSRDLAFAQKHLRILSGLYGCLKPLDLIQAYRLEMGTALKQGSQQSLYAFWGQTITAQLNQDLAQEKSGLLVNLASKEYFKSVKENELDATVITPVFKDFKNGQYKVISFFAKKARGLMAAYLIKNRLEKISDLLCFDLDGYHYSANDSTDHSPVFLRKASQ
ncbi:MAG: peroxide stress protein YaaA [Pseudomonadales bacterium]|nr:peroxide stress protein YaaA [Pseudomonadales bacterium]